MFPSDAPNTKSLTENRKKMVSVTQDTINEISHKIELESQAWVILKQYYYNNYLQEDMQQSTLLTKYE